VKLITEALKADQEGRLEECIEKEKAALKIEEFPRSRLPPNMMAVAECLRRSGAEKNAMNWYLALAQMPETQPRMRAEIRAQGKALSALLGA